ncbi:hypothetical protein [Nocardia africana]|uniref:Uncharacterized protein n=1 Tax=Nocardia africana TaxID=134964 RepID=A0A379X4P7_9NOCA|nr:hypothetical protein [Nocardia africana]MCC3318481.1 hypothetical protein [Nocardia africana]SUH72004.1 Uncharacterised protein [Nocardia africana]
MTEPVVGLYALRTFRVESASGRLLPVTTYTAARGNSAWDGGVCVAECVEPTSDPHRPPSEQCGCGIYGFGDLQTLRTEYRQAHAIVAVIALEGTVLEGERGYRAEAARIVALWADSTILGAELVARIRGHLPDVAHFDDVEELIAAHPGLRHTRPPRPAGDTSGALRTGRRRGLLVGRWPVQRAHAVAVGRWWIRVGMWVSVLGWHGFVGADALLGLGRLTDALIDVGRSATAAALTLGAPDEMWWGLLPLAVVAGLYIIAPTRTLARRFMYPAAVAARVTSASSIVAALLDHPSVARAPVVWLTAVTVSVLIVIVRSDPSRNGLGGTLIRRSTLG